MPVEPATMSSALPSNMPGEVIKTDRLCLKCNYNLKGLQVGGACPECGTAITNAKASVRFADNLVDAPIGYIRLIALGLSTQAATVLTITVLLILSRFHNSGTPLIPPMVENGLMLAATAAWLGAAWLITLKRPKTDRLVPDAILDNPKIRLAVRLSQSLPFLATGIAWTALLTGFGLLSALAGLIALGALFGLVPLGIYLSSLADWAGETDEGSRLRAATWCITVCGALCLLTNLALLINPPFSLLLLFIAVITGLIVVGGVLMFAWSVLALAKGSLWAIQNAHASRERQIRIANKKHRQAMRDAARAQAASDAIAASAPPESFADDPSVVPFADDPIPLTGVAPVKNRNEHTIDRKLDALLTPENAGKPAESPSQTAGDASDHAEPEIYGLEPEN